MCIIQRGTGSQQAQCMLAEALDCRAVQLLSKRQLSEACLLDQLTHSRMHRVVMLCSVVLRQAVTVQDLQRGCSS